MWLLGPCFSGMGGLITLSLERRADAGKPEKQGWGRLCAWWGVEQTLKLVEWLQARALGPQGAHPPPLAGQAVSIFCAQAGEALSDSHWLTNMKASYEWEAQRILKAK